MSYPVVLVISNCAQTSPLDVIASTLNNVLRKLLPIDSSLLSITDIRKIPNDDKIHQNDESVIYLHNINTKYYNTQIAFLPVDSTECLSEASASAVEGVLVYFNANDVSVPNTVVIDLKLPLDLVSPYTSWGSAN